MMIIGDDVNAPDKEDDLEQLQKMLELQTELVKQGDSSGRHIENLCRQTDLIIKSIIKTGVLNLEQNHHRRERIKKQYEILQLSLTATKEEVREQLVYLNKGKKTIRIYQGSI